METHCGGLHDILRSLPRYTFRPSRGATASDGVYFIFERGETGHGGDRIARIGSHRGHGNLMARLREHVTKNKDRSIFRKNVGRALLNRERDPFLEIWNFDLTTRANRTRFGPQVDMARQQEVEAAVSKHIEENMSFTFIEAPDSETALEFERLSIATVAACGSCGPSAGWLGSSSPVPQIRESGLWLVQHLHGPGLADADLAALAECARRGSQPVIDKGQ